MTSTPSPRLRFEEQAAGDNLNTWGPKAVAAWLRLEEAIAGRSAVTVNAAVTLTAANYTTDQARSMFLDLTGAGGFAVTIPTVEKVYIIRNACAADVTITTGASGGANATVHAGDVGFVASDGTNVYSGKISGSYLPITGGEVTGDLRVDGTVTALIDIELQTSGGAIRHYNPSAPAGDRRWQQIVDGGGLFHFQITDDANTVGVDWLIVHRSGQTVTELEFPSGAPIACTSVTAANFYGNATSATTAASAGSATTAGAATNATFFASAPSGNEADIGVSEGGETFYLLIAPGGEGLYSSRLGWALENTRDGTGWHFFGNATSATTAGSATYATSAGSAGTCTTAASATTAATASNANNLGGQAPSFYTDIPSRLGYTPLNPGNNLADLANLASALSNLGLTGSSGGGGWGNSWSFKVPVNISGSPVEVIVQGGVLTGATEAGSPYTVTYSTPFPNACWGIYPVTRTTNFNTNADCWAQLIGTPTKNNFQVAAQQATGTPVIDIPYIAVGY